MGRDQHLFEWTVKEDAEEWPESEIAPEPAPTAPGRRQPALLVVGFCLLLAAGWMWYAWQSERHPTQGKITTLAQGQVRSLKPERLGWVAPHVANAADQLWQAQVASELVELRATIERENETAQSTVGARLVARQDSMALVEVTTHNLHEDQRYRQTRLYRHTAVGWHQIATIGEIWGPWQEMQTEYFTVRYRPLDADAVAEAAPGLDRLYEKMLRDFGLSEVARKQRPVISLVTSNLPYGYGISLSMRMLLVSSPAALPVPIKTGPATVLSRSVVFPLAELMLYDEVLLAQFERIEQYPAQPHPAQMELGLDPQYPMSLPQTRAVWADGGPLADYVVAAYDRERLSLLLDELGNHQRWETLVSAVFDVSADEFKKGWRAYLEERYSE